MYPEHLVQPMIEDLTVAGFKELKSVEAVDATMQEKGTTLVVINSVCGCSAASARPGVKMSLENGKVPDRLVTTFAGFDIDSTQKIREYMFPFPPSSPSIALFKDGELVHMLERHHIEGRSAEIIAENLKQAYDEFC